MRRLALFIIIFVLLHHTGALAQNDTQKVAGYKLPAVIEKGDTVAIYTLDDSHVSATMDAETLQKQKEWNRLLNSVRVTMPYALYCSGKMNEINQKMAALDKRRDKKKYLREEREQLVKDYSEKLKDLSAYQGALLIKLIYRQTGHTTYDLIRDYESGFTAGFWQTISRLDGLNLRDTYDPQKDVLIETAIKTAGF